MGPPLYIENAARRGCITPFRAPGKDCEQSTSRCLNRQVGWSSSPGTRDDAVQPRRAGGVFKMQWRPYFVYCSAVLSSFTRLTRVEIDCHNVIPFGAAAALVGVIYRVQWGASR